MGFLEEKEKVFKEAEERAKALKEKEEAVFKAAAELEKKQEPEDIYKAGQSMQKTYGDYGEAEKKSGFIKKVLEWLGF